MYLIVSCNKYLPASKLEKLPRVSFFSCDSVSLFFQGLLVREGSLPQVYLARPQSTLQQKRQEGGREINSQVTILKKNCSQQLWFVVFYKEHLLEIRTLILSCRNLWHRAGRILSAEGSFGLAWTLAKTVSLADHEPTNSLKRRFIINVFTIKKNLVIISKNPKFLLSLSTISKTA